MLIEDVTIGDVYYFGGGGLPEYYGCEFIVDAQERWDEDEEVDRRSFQMKLLYGRGFHDASWYDEEDCEGDLLMIRRPDRSRDAEV